MSSQNTITEPHWRCHVPNLLKEVLEANPNMWAMKMPFNILLQMLYDLGKIAERINDPELNAMMLRLAIFEQGDPDQADDATQKEVGEYIRKHSRHYK